MNEYNNSPVKSGRGVPSALAPVPLSARAAMRVLRVSRTIADLAHETAVDSRALAEALSYRGSLED